METCMNEDTNIMIVIVVVVVVVSSYLNRDTITRSVFVPCDPRAG